MIQNIAEKYFYLIVLGFILRVLVQCPGNQLSFFKVQPGLFMIPVTFIPGGISINTLIDNIIHVPGIFKLAFMFPFEDNILFFFSKPQDDYIVFIELVINDFGNFFL